MAKFLKSAQNIQLIIKLIPIFLIILVILAEPTNSISPEYDSFNRDQRAYYSPDESDIMRI